MVYIKYYKIYCPPNNDNNNVNFVCLCPKIDGATESINLFSKFLSFDKRIISLFSSSVILLTFVTSSFLCIWLAIIIVLNTGNPLCIFAIVLYWCVYIPVIVTSSPGLTLSIKSACIITSFLLFNYI